MVVIDLAKKDEPPQPRYFVNPEIVWSSEEQSVYEEGCLSIPQYYEDVERPASAARAFPRSRRAAQEILAEGLLSTALQHEIDHLDGVLFIDHISKLKRDRVTKKFIKQAKQRESEEGDRDRGRACLRGPQAAGADRGDGDGRIPCALTPR